MWILRGIFVGGLDLNGRARLSVRRAGTAEDRSRARAMVVNRVDIMVERMVSTYIPYYIRVDSRGKTRGK